jgi:diamine N-acetyltransferase
MSPPSSTPSQAPSDAILLRQGASETPPVSLVAMTPEVAAQLGPAFADMDPWARLGFTANALTQYFANPEPGAPRYAVRVGDAIAGAAGFRTAWLRGPYLQFLGLLTPYQGQNVGPLVLAWFEGQARARGERNLWVAASDFNPAAIRFYERHGFRHAALFEDLIADGYNEILLRKRLLPLDVA